MPRWVKVSGLVAILVVLALLALLILGGGQHGPWQHGPRDHGPGHTPPEGHPGDHSGGGGQHAPANGAGGLALGPAVDRGPHGQFFA
jgi:hypothetical protein